jgi:hypothetical protein
VQLKVTHQGWQPASTLWGLTDKAAMHPPKVVSPVINTRLTLAMT